MIPTTIQVNKAVKGELTPRHAEFSWEFPETVQEALEKYGEAYTLRLITDSITLALQAPARKVLEACDAGWTTEQYSSKVSEVMANHKLEMKRSRGATTPRVDPYQQMAMDLADPEKKELLLAKFRSLGINLEIEEETQEEFSVSRRR